jgi:hypothetical protein
MAGIAEAQGKPQTPGQKVAAAALIALMVLGSFMLWVGAPLFWLWVGSQVQKSSQPSMGPYLVVLVGVVASMIVIGKLLSRLNRTYSRVTGTTGQVRVRMPWHRSLRGERTSGRPTTVLDIVMVATVAVAGVVFLLWFLVLAGNPLPGG